MSRRILGFLLLGIVCAAYQTAKAMASIGPPGADSEGIAVDPNDPNIAYLASYGGGVAKTTDGGASWSEANSGITNRSIWAVAIDPADSNTVYAGGAGGIYRSTDGGQQWTRASGTSSINALSIDIPGGNAIYGASLGGGVFKSTDGVTWAAVNNGLTNRNVWSLTVDPSTADTVYAATNGGGIFKTVDGGANWTDSSVGLTNRAVFVIGVNPLDPNLVYAGTSSSIFKSTDGGASWSAANQGLPSGPFGFAIAFDPNTGTAYLGIIGGLYKSIDGGAWVRTDSGLAHSFIYAMAVFPSESSTPPPAVGSTRALTPAAVGPKSTPGSRICLFHSCRWAPKAPVTFT